MEGGCSSGAESSTIARAPLPPPNMAEEEEDLPPRAGSGLLRADFVDDGDLEWATAEILERSKDEHAEHVKRRKVEEELNELRLCEGIELSRVDMSWGASDDEPY